MVRGSFVHCSDQRVRHRVCSGAVHLAYSPPPPVPYFFFSLPLFHQCDGDLEWGLMAGYSIQGLAGHSGSPWVSQAPSFHLSEAVGKHLLYS